MALDNYKVARPYAKAVFEKALAANVLEEWGVMFAILEQAIQLKQVLAIVRHPRITNEEKVSFFAGFNGNKEIQNDVENFFKILAENKRFESLKEMAELFSKLYDEHNEKLKVNVLSSMPLNDIQVEKLKQTLKKKFNKKIEIKNDIDESILGGVVIKAGDVIIDLSVKTQLKKMVNQLVA